MKTINVSLISLLLLFTANALFAQDLPFSVTANAGISVSDMDIQHLKTNVKVGYNFNVTLEYNLPKKFFLQTGLEFSSKGAKVDDRELADFNNDGVLDIWRIGGKYNTQYLTIPLMAGYRLPLSPGLRMNLSLGPYFGYGIGGKTKLLEVRRMGLTENSSIPPIGENNESYNKELYTKSFNILKRFDMGLKGNVGIEYYRCLLNIGYEYGFIDQYKGDKLSSYNMNLFVTLGFRIF